MGTIAQEDKEVKQANFTGNLPDRRCPRSPKPRTTENPEAEEIWQLTLQDAIRIGLDNSEVVRVISLGAQGIPVGGFEPTPLNTGAGAGIASSLGAGHADDGLRPGDPGDPDRPRPCRTSTPTSPPACSGATASRRSTTPSRPASSSPGPSSRSSSTRTPRPFQTDLPEADRHRCRARRPAQHQLPLLEQPDQRLPVGLHDQHPAHDHPALAGRHGAEPAAAWRPTGPTS